METIVEKRAGNIILRIEKDEELETLVVKTVAGQFEMRLRNDMINFHIVRDLMEKGEEDMYDSLTHLWFLIISAAPDGEFLKDLSTALDNLYERYENAREAESEDPESAEEEERKAIEDVEMLAQLEEAISEAEGESEYDKA